MIIKDEVYGAEKIKERVLIALINSKEIQRLKKVSQFGMPSKYYHIHSYSRYEHSIGVLILLRKLKASIEEQIAGLIHDVSHTAFSHVIDWVIGDATKEDYQDNIFSEFIKTSGIPFILETHGFDHKNFMNLEKFSLLEQPAPALCADRFDYAIREIKDFEDKEFIINNLKNFNGRMVFVSKKTAELFAKGYIKCQNGHWAGNEAKARYFVLAKTLKKALDEKIISLEDLKSDEERVLNLLNKSNNKLIFRNLELLKKKKIVKNDSGAIILKKKFRFVDPEVLVESSIIKLSDISEEYRKILNNEKQNSFLEKGISIEGF